MVTDVDSLLRRWRFHSVKNAIGLHLLARNSNSYSLHLLHHARNDNDLREGMSKDLRILNDRKACL